MKIKHIEKGHKAKFETLEDVMQTFFAIARAIYDASTSDEEDKINGVVTATATVPDKGVIRIRVDYLKEGEKDA